ncbi:Heat stress transcription factor B-3, partial [Mucuna pruriens]
MKQGFRKVATSRWEFCNERFRKGEKELLCEIQRKKAWVSKRQHTIIAPIQATPQDSDDDQRSLSMSSCYAILMGENKRLKRENWMLSSELTIMKTKCRELLDLVAKYSLLAKEQGKDDRPMIFRVRLQDAQGEREIKKKKAEISETTSILLSPF